MYIWIAAFAYDEFSGMTDAGMLFYQMDFWSLWNVGIIGVGLAFVIARESSASVPWLITIIPFVSLKFYSCGMSVFAAQAC
jgi:hypothetical protein